jgi:hypothetical protein
MADLTAALQDIRTKVAAAVDAVDDDGKASRVLAAVVREFAAKTDKAIGLSRDPATATFGLYEAEQAGDSARYAAEADTGAADATRSVVLDAHLAICTLKASVSPG